MVRVLLAPDSFKGTFSASEVAALVAEGLHDGGAEAVCLPVADGGEGTSEIMASALGASARTATVTGPWGELVDAAWHLGADGTAYLDMAQASGITLPGPTPRDAIAASSYGTGELIVAAARAGARRILVAAGGSATSDGGMGALAAIRELAGEDAFSDGGAHADVEVEVLSDVVTPYEDAAVVFGPQKGATAGDVAALTRRLHAQAASLPRDPRGVPATGAAGGLSGALWAQHGARLVSGADRVLDVIDFDAALKRADHMVVGEGRLDAQSTQGKIVSRILARAAALPGVGTHAVVGSLGPDADTTAFSSVTVASTAHQLRNAGRDLAAALTFPPQR